MMSKQDAEAYLAAVQAAHDAGYHAGSLQAEYGAGPYDEDDLDWHWRNGYWLGIDSCDD